MVSFSAGVSHRIEISDGMHLIPYKGQCVFIYVECDEYFESASLICFTILFSFVPGFCGGKHIAGRHPPFSFILSVLLAPFFDWIMFSWRWSLQYGVCGIVDFSLLLKEGHLKQVYRTGYIICGTQNKRKTWTPYSEIIKHFKMASADH